MKYPRVNLLRKSEQRYQGAVSRRFITISAVLTPILLVAVLSGIKLVQYTGVQSDLKASQEIWSKLEPKLTLFNEENRSLAANRQVLTLFEGWQGSQLPMVDLLNEIQNIVPGNVQFTRLLLRGEVGPGTYETAEDMKLGFSLRIEGISQGERAEENVWRFHKDLLSTAEIRQAFDSVDLSDMRARRSQGGDAVREFRIIGSNASTGGDPQ
jgi:Tfp pilus assembly protein PilN